MDPNVTLNEMRELAQRLLHSESYPGAIGTDQGAVSAARRWSDGYRLAELFVEFDKRAVSSGAVPGEWTTPSQAGARQIVERLEYLLLVYFHAHDSGSNVPPHVVAQASSLVKP